MRPPQITGENEGIDPGWAYAPGRFNEAPADHGGKHSIVAELRANGFASMRPPQITGENAGHAGEPGEGAGRGFNEAPADHGGKPLTAANGSGDSNASMRPPQITGENRATPETRP